MGGFPERVPSSGLFSTVNNSGSPSGSVASSDTKAGMSSFNVTDCETATGLRLKDVMAMVTVANAESNCPSLTL